MNPKVASRLIVAALFLLTPLSAFGEDTEEMGEEYVDEATDEDQADDEQEEAALQRAQDHFDTGAELYYESDYGQAAVEFRRAHQIHAHPLFLYNFALATKQLGRLDDALEAATEAEAMDEPLPPDQAERNRAVIDSIPTVQHIRTTAEEAAEDRADVAAPPDVEADDGIGPVGWIGAGALALGTAGLATGAITHYRVRGDREELDERRDRTSDSDAIAELESQVSSRETTRTALYLSGLGLVAAGTGFIIWESQMGPDTDARALDVSVGPTNASVSLSW